MTSPGFETQIARILSKLDAARQADPRFAVFGADLHRYRLGPPLSDDAIHALEAKIGQALPEAFAAFLTAIGHGGQDSLDAAGPFYGIYRQAALEAQARDARLSRPVLLEPAMEAARWAGFVARLEAADGEAAYDAVWAELFGGLLTIGHQGCSCETLLVMNGPYRGRIVNVDYDCLEADGYVPRFAFEANFLDWYERWLNEVIDGTLRQDGPYWFGYVMGGGEAHLLALAKDRDQSDLRKEALLGLVNVPSVSDQTCEDLLTLCQAREKDISTAALAALCKFSFARARPVLLTKIAGPEEDFRDACHAVSTYAETHSRDLAEAVARRLARVEAADSCVPAFRVLKAAGYVDENLLRNLAGHRIPTIRAAALMQIAELPDRSGLLPAVTTGLRDHSPDVVRAALQALAGMRDPSLLPVYREVAARFPLDESNFVRVNLAHRLHEFGFAGIEAFLAGEHPSPQRMADFNPTSIQSKLRQLLRF